MFRYGALLITTVVAESGPERIIMPKSRRDQGRHERNLVAVGAATSGMGCPAYCGATERPGMPVGLATRGDRPMYGSGYGGRPYRRSLGPPSRSPPWDMPAPSCS